MRHFLAVFGTLAGLLSVFVASPLKTAANDWKIVPGERIGDVSLTMSEDEIAKSLGPPTQATRSPTGQFASYVWANHQIIVVTISSRVEAITIIPGPKILPYRTDKGIGLGASMSQVREAYGDSGCVFKDESSTDRILEWPGLGIKFLFSSGSDIRQEIRSGVVTIQVQRPSTGPVRGRPCSELG